jgi:hypothetical protein
VSLSFLTRLLLFLLLVTPVAVAGGRYGPELGSYLLQARMSATQETRFASRAIVYRLERERPTAFAFSRPAILFKLIVHPTVAEMDRAYSPGFVYGFGIRLLDSEGAEIEQREIYFHADPPDVVFASGLRWRFFRNRPELVAGQDSIEIQSEERVSSLEIVALDSDPAVVGIDVRLYETRPFLGQQALASFRRLSEEEKVALAGANAFPPDMLTAEEMSNIGLNRWRPVGPTGIADRDYLSLIVYEGMLPLADEGEE